jgi:hypothetical protein
VTIGAPSFVRNVRHEGVYIVGSRADLIGKNQKGPELPKVCRGSAGSFLAFPPRED